MAKEFRVAFRLPGSPAECLELLTDEDRLTAIMVETESLDPVVSVNRQGGAVVVSVRRGFRGEWPDFLKTFIGERIDIHEQREWGTADHGGLHGSLQVQVLGKPVTMSGSMSVAAVSATESAVEISGTVRCSVPFVGAKVEELAAGVMVDAINTEARVLGAPRS